MDSQAKPPGTQGTPLLNVFCAEEGEAWRVHALPASLPAYLRPCFDRLGEAFPVFLDFEDLERYMLKRNAPYEKRVSRLGGVELTARGQAANELAQWFARALASGVRQVDENADQDEPKRRPAGA